MFEAMSGEYFIVCVIPVFVAGFFMLYFVIDGAYKLWQWLNEKQATDKHEQPDLQRLSASARRILIAQHHASKDRSHNQRVDTHPLPRGS